MNPSCRDKSSSLSELLAMDRKFLNSLFELLAAPSARLLGMLDLPCGGSAESPDSLVIFSSFAAYSLLRPRAMLPILANGCSYDHLNA
jgi:hypothetical protein